MTPEQFTVLIDGIKIIQNLQLVQIGVMFGIGGFILHAIEKGKRG